QQEDGIRDFHVTGVQTCALPISICSSPKSGELQVAIKEVKDGTFSSYANNQLKIGDVIEVAPPKGRFVFEPNDNKTKNIAAFARSEERRVGKEGSTREQGDCDKI